MTGAGTGAPKRGTYRHGDLRRALVAAGVEMARRGGPEAGVPPGRRSGAEFLAWSAVHGLGMLLIDGPLGGP